ncbi:MAG: glycoside hydrolase family 2 TIM barrel-domain containing protein [Rikenellaceae bacterium]
MKKQLLAILGTLLLACTQSIYAQQTVNIMNIADRNTTSLDGLWQTLVDPFENGYYDYRLQPYDGGYAQDKSYKKEDRTNTLQEYSFDGADELFVPGDWNTQKPELYYYEGTVWYRKRFEYNLEEGNRLFLNFGAANYETIVWLNGERLGSHIGGFTGFNFEITDKLSDGENSLVVKVDNKRKPEAVPTVNTDWWNFGGITRPVTLIETPSTFIESYYVQLDKDDTRTIEGWVRLNGTQKNQTVKVEIPELKIVREVTTDSDGYAEFTVKSKPELWSPENPKLYAVNVVAQSDRVSDEIGFRTITTQGTDILLNGKKIFCRGVSVHEETPYDSGRAYSVDHAETLLGWAKEMGCNFVRLAHYPHNEDMVKTAERMGLLVWSEIPVYWTIHWENPDTYRNAEKQLTDMIERDINRCNVIIWSIANETPHSDARLTFLSRLVDKIHTIDDVRLVGAAMEKEEIERNVLTVNDPLSEKLDIISFNQYVGWYDGAHGKCDIVNWVFESQKPVFISEFGGGALYGNHGGEDEYFTEEYQRVLYEKQIAMLKRIEGLAGTTPWILKDFRSPRRQVPGIQDGFNRKGLVSDKGQKKQAFFTMLDWYNELAEEYK